MKSTKSVLVVFFLMNLLVMPGCKCGDSGTGAGGSYVPRTGKVILKPVDDLPRNFTYCRYEVTGAPSQGPASIKVGEFVCIKCPSTQSGCDNFSEIEIGDGQVYPVKAKDNGLACTSCPAGTATPPGYPFEEQ